MAQEQDGSRLSPEDVRHRLSDDDAARLGLLGWRRWGVGPAVAGPRRAKLQITVGLAVGSAQLALELRQAIGADQGVATELLGGGLVLLSAIVFYVGSLVLYSTYRSNVDHGVYERLAEARRLEAQELQAARSRGTAQRG